MDPYCVPHKPLLITRLQRGRCGASWAIRWVVGCIRRANAFKGHSGVAFLWADWPLYRRSLG